MSEHLGPPIVRDSDEYRCIAAIISAVGRLSRLPSRWNGEVLEELDSRWGGSANEDGSIGAGDSEVLAHLRKALAGATLDAEDSALVRNAVAVVAHEAMHLSTRHPTPDAPGAYPALDVPEKVLDEGLTEFWTQANVVKVMHAVGLDRYADQAADVDSVDPDPAYTEAVRGLVDELHRIIGRNRQDITRDLLAFDPAQRWDAITDLVINHYLEGVEPPPDLDDLRRRLAGTLRADCARVHALQFSGDDVTKQTRDGQHAGRQAVTNLAVAVEEIADDQRAAARIPFAGVRR